MRTCLATAVLVVLASPLSPALAAQVVLPRQFGNLELGMPLAALHALTPDAALGCSAECLPEEAFLDLSLAELPETRDALLRTFWGHLTPPPPDYAIDVRLYDGHMVELGLPAPDREMQACLRWLAARFGPWWRIELLPGHTGLVKWRDAQTILTLTFEVRGDLVLPDLRQGAALSLHVSDRRSDSLMTLAYLRRGLVH